MIATKIVDEACYILLTVLLQSLDMVIRGVEGSAHPQK